MPLLLLLVITSLHSSSKHQKMCVCVPPTSVTSKEAVCKLVNSCGKMMEPQCRNWTYTPYSCNFESILGLEVRGKRPPELPWTDASLSCNNFRTEMKKPGRNIYLSKETRGLSPGLLLQLLLLLTVKSCGKMMEPQYRIWTYTPYSCNFESILGLEVRSKQPPELPWTDSSLSRNNFRTEMKKPGRNIHM